MVCSVSSQSCFCVCCALVVMVVMVLVFTVLVGHCQGAKDSSSWPCAGAAMFRRATARAQVTGFLPKVPLYPSSFTLALHPATAPCLSSLHPATDACTSRKACSYFTHPMVLLPYGHACCHITMHAACPVAPHATPRAATEVSAYVTLWCLVVVLPANLTVSP